MAFSELDLARIHKTVGAMVNRRQPPAAMQDQLRLELEIDGHRVRVWTVRPRWNEPTQITRSAVAQFTYTATTRRWTLYWMRRDLKWHAWPTNENITDLATLVRIVDEDVDGAFWG